MIKVLGKLNLVVQHNQGRKQLVVHVDRVCHLTLAENESFFDSKEEHEGACELLTDESEPEEENQEAENKENKADQDFSEYVQTSPQLEDNVAEQAEEPQVQRGLPQRVT